MEVGYADMWVKIGTGCVKKEDEANRVVTSILLEIVYQMLYSVKQGVRVLGNINAPDAHEEEKPQEGAWEFLRRRQKMLEGG